MVTELWGRVALLCSRLEALAPSVVAATPRKERGGAQSSGFVTCRPANRTVVASYCGTYEFAPLLASIVFKDGHPGTDSTKHSGATIACRLVIPPIRPLQI